KVNTSSTGMRVSAHVIMSRTKKSSSTPLRYKRISIAVVSSAVPAANAACKRIDAFECSKLFMALMFMALIQCLDTVTRPISGHKNTRHTDVQRAFSTKQLLVLRHLRGHTSDNVVGFAVEGISDDLKGGCQNFRCDVISVSGDPFL